MFKLQDMRNTKKIKWITYIGFGLIIISFVFFYGWNTQSQGSNDPIPVAELGNLTIYQEDLEQSRLSLIREKLSRLDINSQRLLSRNPNQWNQLYDFEEVIEQAANLILLKAHSKEKGLDLSREQVAEDLKKIPGAINQGVTWSQIEQQLQSRITGLSLDLKATLAHASLYEVWQEYLLANEELALDIATYPSAEFEGQVVATDEELENYLNDHQEEFHVPDQRRYQFVKLTRDDILNQMEFTDEQLQAFYEQNQADYIQEAALKAEEIVMPASADRSTTQAAAVFLTAMDDGRLTSGTWYNLARDLNTEHPDFRFFSNSTGWLEAGSLSRPDPYIRAVHTLADDQVSSPIITDKGVYVTRVTDRRAGGVPPLNEVMFEVERDYKNSRIDDLFNEHYQQWRDELGAVSAAGGSFRDFAGAVKLEDQLTTMVDRTQYFIGEIGTDFSEDSEYFEYLGLNVISDVIRQNDLLVVLQVMQEVDEHDPPLDMIRSDVESAVQKERALSLARAAADQAYNLIREGADFRETLADAPGKPFIAESFKRTQSVPKLNYPLIGFNEASLALKVGKTGVLPYGYDGDQPVGYAVWNVSSLQEPTREDFKAERSAFVASYLRLQQNAIIGEWLKDERTSKDFRLVENTN